MASLFFSVNPDYRPPHPQPFSREGRREQTTANRTCSFPLSQQPQGATRALCTTNICCQRCNSLRSLPPAPGMLPIYLRSRASDYASLIEPTVSTQTASIRTDHRRWVQQAQRRAPRTYVGERCNSLRSLHPTHAAFSGVTNPLGGFVTSDERHSSTATFAPSLNHTKIFIYLKTAT